MAYTVAYVKSKVSIDVTLKNYFMLPAGDLNLFYSMLAKGQYYTNDFTELLREKHLMKFLKKKMSS